MNETKHKLAVALRNRVVDFRQVKGSELVRNDANWRMHPDDQQGGLAALMEDVGFVGAVIAREDGDGKLVLIDGHLRADLAGDEEIPVLVVDLTDEEAEKVLLTYDPIGQSAATNTNRLAALLDNVTFDENAYMRKLITDLHADLAKKEKKAKKDGEEDEDILPDMELHPNEHYDFLVVLATSTNEWNVLCDRLDLKPDDHPHRARMGTCRAVRAAAVLAMMKEPELD